MDAGKTEMNKQQQCKDNGKTEHKKKDDKNQNSCCLCGEKAEREDTSALARAWGDIFPITI